MVGVALHPWPSQVHAPSGGSCGVQGVQVGDDTSAAVPTPGSNVHVAVQLQPYTHSQLAGAHWCSASSCAAGVGSPASHSAWNRA